MTRTSIPVTFGPNGEFEATIPFEVTRGGGRITAEAMLHERQSGTVLERRRVSADVPAPMEIKLRPALSLRSGPAGCLTVALQLTPRMLARCTLNGSITPAGVSDTLLVWRTEDLAGPLLSAPFRPGVLPAGSYRLHATLVGPDDTGVIAANDVPFQVVSGPFGSE